MSVEIATLWSRADAIGVKLSHFAIGSHTLSPAHISYIKNEIGPKLRESGSVHLVGLASRSGGAALNQALSRRRADAVLAQLRAAAGNDFKVLNSEASGEKAAQLAGLKDGTEDPGWRAVMLLWWKKSEPPPAEEPPPAPTMVSRFGGKEVALPDSGVPGEQGGGHTGLARQIRGIRRPDSQVSNGRVINVPEASVVTQIDIRRRSKGAVNWYEINFTWGQPASPSALVPISGAQEKHLSQKVAMEVYEHPGHFLLRPRTEGTSGWSP